MWAALTSGVPGVEGSLADDYPEDVTEDMNLDSTEEADLIKKREWHVEWLETVISYHGTFSWIWSSTLHMGRLRVVKRNWDATLPTLNKVNEWALSCSKAQNAVPSYLADRGQVPQRAHEGLRCGRKSYEVPSGLSVQS
jgi:hypothetical protein